MSTTAKCLCVRVFTGVFALLLGTGGAEANERPKRILLLEGQSATQPGGVATFEAFRRRLNENSLEKYEVDFDHLDLARFPGQSHAERAARYLGEKHAQKPLDLVVPNGRGSLRTLLQYRDLIAPNVPIVYCCVTQALADALNVPSDAVGVLTEYNWFETLVLAKRLQPGARNLVMISGASETDRAWQGELLRAIEPELEKFNVRHLAGLPRDELLKDVSLLSRDTIVLLTVVFADRDGRAFVPGEIAKDVAAHSGAPVYTSVPGWVGNGVVGGYLDSFEAQGAAAADLALQVLSAKDQTAIPRTTKSAHAYRVDSRALERWKLREAALPAGTVVSFKAPSLWEEHGDLVLAAGVIFALQTIFAGALLIQRRKRQHAEALLQESEERMTFAAASANIGLWQFNRSTNELWTTDHCRALFGLGDTQYLTRDAFLAAIHPEDRRAAISALREASTTTQPFVSDLRVVLPGDRIGWVRVRARAHSHDQFSGIFLDITNQKVAEAEAATQRQEVAHLLRVSVLGELSGSIAHEINQPLTAILSNAQAALSLLANDGAPDLTEIREALLDIVQEDNRANEVILRLRKLLKKGDRQSERIDLNQLVTSTITMLNSELIGRGVNIQVDLTQELPAASGDSVQLQQVLLNLLMNAMDAMVSTPLARRLITISTRRAKPGVLEVLVKDAGPGIPPLANGQLFEPFYTTKDHGLGLGLTICSTIIKAHAGTLNIENHEHGGAIAAFTLPTQDGMSAAQ